MTAQSTAVLDAAASTTRPRILDAALTLFADRGYERTSVRQICAAAGANVAAVNYHFGSKRALYDAAIDFARAEANVRNPYVQLDRNRDFWKTEAPAERLRLFIAMMVAHGFDDDGRTSALVRLVAHELITPTDAYERQVQISINRVWNALRDLCRELMGPQADDDTVTRMALQINGQCQYPALMAEPTRHMSPTVTLDRAGQEVFAHEVYTAALAGLRAVAAAMAD